MNGMGFLAGLWPKKLRHTREIRIFHWVLTGSYFLLLYTGQHISHPHLVPFPGMRRARLGHFAGQFAFLGAVLWRIHHGIKAGNYREIIPDGKTLSRTPAYLRYELFLSSREPKFSKYNPLQKFLYTLWLPLFLLLGATGMVLYIPQRLARLEKAFGGLNRTRRLHYLLSLVSTSTVMGHIYFTLTSGKETLKSIFTGYKAWGKK
jgi:Ni/Fe-hydrogenase b-type cytochrome subunit